MVTSPLRATTSVLASAIKASIQLVISLMAIERPIETEMPSSPANDPAMEAAPAIAEIAEPSSAVRVMLSALIPVGPSPLI